MKPDNRSASAVRSKNRSHGQYNHVCEIIKQELMKSHGMDFWQIKYNLAGKLSAQYDMPIGEVNHMIEREARRMKS